MFDEKIKAPDRGGADRHAGASGSAKGAARRMVPERPVAGDAALGVSARILSERYGDLPALDLVRVMLRDVFHGRIALVSSFGTEAAVLLDLVAQVEPTTPVLFLDTGKLFAETLRYRDTLAARLGLTDIRVLRPAASSLAAEDREGALWREDADRCCFLRKVMPLRLGLNGFDAWITGRKRFHGGERGQLPAIEADAEGKIKINPLAGWSPAEIAAYFINHDLPRHEMEADGYRSIGCVPCTDRVKAWEDPRAGRWRNTRKTECGIHRRRSDPGDLASPTSPLMTTMP